MGFINSSVKGSGRDIIDNPNSLTYNKITQGYFLLILLALRSLVYLRNGNIR